MSFKAKDLAYEAQEPPFLRKLRAQQAGVDPDRHERQLARPRRTKTAADDEEDAPTYVDETTNEPLSKQEYEALLGKEAPSTLQEDAALSSEQEAAAIPSEAKADGEGPAGLEAAAAGTPAADQPRTKQDVSEAGKSLKKRKAIKAVGSGGDDAADGEDAPKETSSKKPKKKPAKAVKLSFRTDDG